MEGGKREGAVRESDADNDAHVEESGPLLATSHCADSKTCSCCSCSCCCCSWCTLIDSPARENARVGALLLLQVPSSLLPLLIVKLFILPATDEGRLLKDEGDPLREAGLVPFPLPKPVLRPGEVARSAMPPRIEGV